MTVNQNKAAKAADEFMKKTRYKVGTDTFGRVWQAYWRGYLDALDSQP